MHQLSEAWRYNLSIFFTLVGTLSKEIFKRFLALEKKRRHGFSLWFLLCSTTGNFFNSNCFCKFCSDHFSNWLHIFCNASYCRQLQSLDSQSKRNWFLFSDVSKDSSYLPICDITSPIVPRLLLLVFRLPGLLFSADPHIFTLFSCSLPV